MSTPEVTVIIANYKTPELTRLCLRLLRMHTAPERCKVIVVDNDSQDESLEYLRGLRWIRLLERRNVGGETPHQMEARAIDLALKEVDTPLTLLMHTDTLIRNDLWLDFLVNRINASPQIAGLGSWKLKTTTHYRRFAGFVEGLAKKFRAEIKPKQERYLRTHCVLYRTELLKRCPGGFDDGGPVGRSIHRRLVEQGYEMSFVTPEELGRFVSHLQHATTVLNPLCSDKPVRLSARRRLRRKLNQFEYRRVLLLDDLDGE